LEREIDGAKGTMEGEAWMDAERKGKKEREGRGMVGKSETHKREKQGEGGRENSPVIGRVK
jgi:hypothetical protein